ncbi:MAG: alpha/beta hydrolase [Anaerolineae bacterium]
MSSLMTEQGLLHFESLGRGKPLLLLHCWLGSWDFWRGTMEALSDRAVGRRIYALDFWGFGESDRRLSIYHVADYIAMVVQFMDQLGIERAPIFGHSMGGTVAMSLAVEHPQRVTRVAVVGSPMEGRSLSLLLKVAGVRWIADVLWRFPPLLRFVIWGYSPWLAKDRKEVYRRMMQTLSQATVASFSESIASLRNRDLRPHLPEVRVPVLGIYGVRDWVVHPGQALVIASLVPQAQVEIFERSGHFPMLDEPERFHQSLLRFLLEEQDDASGAPAGR